MKKVMSGIVLFVLGLYLQADYLKAGVLMCNNADSVRKIVSMHNNGDASGVMNYFSQMQARGVCNQTVAPMTPSNLGRTDLSGGVTKIGSRIFVATTDIR